LTKSKLIRILIVVALAGVVGFAIFLITWDIPRSTETVEKAVPNESFAE
jgi:hypothetical protein